MESEYSCSALAELESHSSASSDARDLIEKAILSWAVSEIVEREWYRWNRRECANAIVWLE